MDILAVPAGSISSGSVPVTNVTGMGTGVQAALQQPATGTGSPVLNNSPALVTPDLGTPSAVNLSNGTALPIATGVSGLGAGVATALTQAATGTGSVVLSSGPTIDLTNASNLPVSAVSGVGTGVTTALGQNVTGSGGIVLQTNAALTTPNIGTPSAGTLSNCSGLPIATGVSGLGSGVATALAAASTGTGGVVRNTSPTIATPIISGAVQSVNGVAGVNNGVDVVVATFHYANQTANVAGFTAYAVPAGQAGWYRILARTIVTTPATTSSTLPNISTTYTDSDSNGTPTASMGLSGQGGNGPSTFAQGTLVLYCKAGTNITVSTSGYASSGATAMQYDLRGIVEYLGA